MIGDPFSIGADQLTTMSWPELVVIGASGVSGGIACKIVKLSEIALYPIEFLASTTNSYVTPSVRPVAV